MNAGKNRIMAEKAFNEFSNAFDKKIIDLHQCGISKDLYLHADQPQGTVRLTYAMFSDDKKTVTAIAIIHFSEHYENGMSKWSIGWCVNPDYRNQQLGTTITKLALDEFVKNMKPNLPSDFYIEASVDPENIASRKIAEKLIGNEEVVKGEDGLESYSYLKKYIK
ncbi:GNAT family N-acetyltransferase [Acinetobacter baumannii]|nr:GNAT family N-acetyltransferase [Acinetobacter baumannii]